MTLAPSPPPDHQPATCNLTEWHLSRSVTRPWSSSAHMASRVAHGLNRRFQQGTPSGSIDRAGVVVRGFDKYTQGPGSHWLPGKPRPPALPPCRPAALPPSRTRLRAGSLSCALRPHLRSLPPSPTPRAHAHHAPSTRQATTPPTTPQPGRPRSSLRGAPSSPRATNLAPTQPHPTSPAYLTL